MVSIYDTQVYCCDILSCVILSAAKNLLGEGYEILRRLGSELQGLLA